VKFTPKSESELVKMYPNIFKLRDSCYSFPALLDWNLGIRKPELKACKYLNEEKEYSNYEFKGIYAGNALIKTAAYEGWGFLSVDLKTGLTCYTMGKPLTADGKTAISYSNYYGDEEIAFTDLQTKIQYVIAIDGWQTIACKIVKEAYYLQLESGVLTDCQKEIKYLKLQPK